MAEVTDFGLAIPEEDQEFVILPDQTKIRFGSTGPLLKYLDDELVAWKGVDNSIGYSYQQVKDLLNQIVSVAQGEELQPGKLAPVRNQLARDVLDSNRIRTCVYSKSKLGQWLIACRKSSPDENVYFHRAVAAYCVAMQYVHFGYNVTGTWALAVADAAVQFNSGKALGKDIERYTQELKSLAATSVKQRADFDSRIAEYESQKAAFDKERRELLDGDNKLFNEHLTVADAKAAEFDTACRARMKALEEAYERKLQLEAPAQYWDKIAKSYLGRGWLLILLAVVLGSIVFYGLFCILLNCDTLPLFDHTTFDAATIRASLIFIALMSIVGYLLHLFTRLAISSFHLSRDYRERFQLTRVYLALIKDGDLKNDDATRQIVLQSLFSRSDTGLLKGDHPLTMPVAVGDMMKGNG